MKKLGNANHAYKGSNNKKEFEPKYTNYNQSTEQRTQDTQEYIQ